MAPPSSVSRFLHPEVSRRMLVDEGELIIDEVTRHWVTRVVPTIVVLLGMGCFLLMPGFRAAWPLMMCCGLLLGSWGFYRIHVEYMDRFVITNMRVFRVHGVVDQHMATMPLSRILDISVRQTFWGQLFGYGHFVFESAAQDQGLKNIHFVPRIEERDLTIQETIYRAGYRRQLAPAGDGT